MGRLAFSCGCGMVSGQVTDIRPALVNRVRCYCRSCQAYALYLDHEREVLDPQGGTDVIQLTADRVQFHGAPESLTCVQLTEKGPLRWHCAECRSPIANTARSDRLPFAGFVHSAFTCSAGDCSWEAVTGPVRANVFTGHAWGEDKPPGRGLLPAVLRFSGTMAVAMVRGAARRSPFFDRVTGLPVAVPKRLSEAELEALYQRCRASV